MNWLFLALICILGWGFADFFYKKSSDRDDSVSHLKIAVWVGLVMGVCAVLLLPLAESEISLASVFRNAFYYSPASLGYIVSMIIGYAGLRYLELSIISPVQNASGAFSMIAMLIFFAVTGTVNDDLGNFSVLNILGTIFVISGVVLLAVVENRLSYKKTDELSKPEDDKKKNRRYRFGALALLFPILYCVFDTIGTAADGIILDEETGLGLGEFDVIILYGLTFFIAGIICWIVLWIKEKKPYNPFTAKEISTKGAAALCEEFGQVFYVFAMAKNPVFAAPVVASYCIISLVLSRILLREKLSKWQYICIFSVVAGIILFGVSEGLAEV